MTISVFATNILLQTLYFRLVLRPLIGILSTFALSQIRNKKFIENT